MTEGTLAYAALNPGDPAPWFSQRTASEPSFTFDMAGGRYVVMCFLGSSADPMARAAIEAVAANRGIFDETSVCFFGVSADPADEKRLRDILPGIRFFFDFDGIAGRLYGSLPVNADEKRAPLRRFWVVIDPALKVMRIFGLDAPDEMFAYLRTLPPPGRFAGFAVPAPVAVIPNVFEPEFCRRLIAVYEQKGGIESGFMREIDGRTAVVLDPNLKRRRDANLDGEPLILEIQARIRRRLLPDVRKIFQYDATRMERYIVSCYRAEDGGHFRPHRDNNTSGTAHRRFAVSINLNDDFDGGELSFPEYGRQSFKMPTGCAVVFSCSLLHGVSPVTRGARYAFLPFLYDAEGARIRVANNKFLDPSAPVYSDPEIEAEG